MIHADAQVRSPDRSRRDELARDQVSQVDRDSKCHSLVATGITGDRRVDADHLPTQVDQGPSAVAWINRCIRLNIRQSIKTSLLRRNDTLAH